MSIRFLEVKRAYYADPIGITVQWRYIGDEQWMDVIGEPDWGGAEEAGVEFRIKPNLLKIGNMEVQRGLSHIPQSGKYAFIADPVMDTLYQQVLVGYAHTDNAMLNAALERGLLHASKDDAILHATALIQVSVNGQIV